MSQGLQYILINKIAAYTLCVTQTTKPITAHHTHNSLG